MSLQGGRIRSTLITADWSSLKNLLSGCQCEMTGIPCLVPQVPDVFRGSVMDPSSNIGEEYSVFNFIRSWFDFASNFVNVELHEVSLLITQVQLEGFSNVIFILYHTVLWKNNMCICFKRNSTLDKICGQWLL